MRFEFTIGDTVYPLYDNDPKFFINHMPCIITDISYDDEMYRLIPIREGDKQFRDVQWYSSVEVCHKWEEGEPDAF